MINLRVISFFLILTMPLWFGLIAGVVVLIEQKFDK